MKGKSGQSGLYLMTPEYATDPQQEATHSQHEDAFSRDIPDILVMFLTSKKKKRHTAAAAADHLVGLITAFVLLICRQELSESRCSLSTIYFPSENGHAVVFECLHGLT